MLSNEAKIRLNNIKASIEHDGSDHSADCMKFVIDLLQAEQEENAHLQSLIAGERTLKDEHMSAESIIMDNNDSLRAENARLQSEVEVLTDSLSAERRANAANSLERERLQSEIDEANAQEPIGYAVEVYWQSMQDPADCGEGLEIYPVDEFEKTDRSKDDENVFPVYARPIPAQQSQAVAVPELKDIEVTDQMASAFNQAICDDAMNDQDIEEVKTGLRAAISHLHPMPKSFYELEIERIVAINDSLLANERRLIERLRTMQPSPRITEQDAREIIESSYTFTFSDHKEADENFKFWLLNVGRSLLNKLNGVQHE